MKTRLGSFSIVAGVVLSAVYACTPLPDLEEDPIINGISPIPLDQIDAAACAADALPPEICARLGTR